MYCGQTPMYALIGSHTVYHRINHIMSAYQSYFYRRFILQRNFQFATVDINKITLTKE